LTSLGVTVHFCGSAGAAESAQTTTGITARRNESEAMETQAATEL
jgi:hypothetical protein